MAQFLLHKTLNSFISYSVPLSLGNLAMPNLFLTFCKLKKHILLTKLILKYQLETKQSLTISFLLENIHMCCKGLK